MNKGEYQDFSYTGNVQTFSVPDTGVYKLEVWGGSGGYGWFTDKTASYKKGGYAVGYKKLKKGITLYVCVGGRGSLESSPGVAGSGGYNGGGGAWAGHAWDSSGNWGNSAGSGGATHIALVDGTLSSIGKTSFDTNGLIVAGGGAGACGYRNMGNDVWVTAGNQGGNQNASGSFGQGTNGSGFCSSGGTTAYASGGGGYLGGTAGVGGSSWIDNVDDWGDYTKSMTQGGNDDWATGSAKITLMQKSTVKLGDKDCEIYLGENQIEEIFLGSKEIG